MPYPTSETESHLSEDQEQALDLCAEIRRHLVDLGNDKGNANIATLSELHNRMVKCPIFSNKVLTLLSDVADLCYRNAKQEVFEDFVNGNGARAGATLVLDEWECQIKEVVVVEQAA